MNKQHRAFRNNLYALRLLWKICPRQVIHKALMRLLGYCEWLFYSAFFMRYVVHALETKQEFSALMTFLMITVTVFAAISLYNNYVNGKVLPICSVQERLESLPEQLATPLTTEFDEKGVNLSGGESQKVAIARAFYGDVDLLAMDEPSSALDPIAEYNLNKAMHEAAKHKTVFYISHRLSTTRDADRIIMLEQGRIIEEGTHDELLAKQGKYAQMWQAQAGKYGA